MDDLKSFIDGMKTKEKTLVAPSNSTIAVSTAGILAASAPLDFSNSKAREFGRHAAELANSQDVLEELSQEIGTPARDETEDEFVDRAKHTLRRILRRKLDQ